jgi:hypothetical protein
MIHDPAQTRATTTSQTRVGGDCLLKSEYPKILSDADSKTNTFIGMSVDQTQGNLFLCGWSLLSTHVTQLYPDNSKKNAINFLLNNLGDVQWHFSFMSLRNSDLSGQACIFSGTGTSILTMIYDQGYSELSIMSQNYDKGDVEWVRKLPGSFDAIDGGFTFQQEYDSVLKINSLYIGPRLSAGNAWHLYKIDISGVAPK